jgi:hypothetical protein
MKNSARYNQKRTYVFMCSVRYSGQILVKLVLSSQIFEKSLNMKFHENPSSES